jgi:hypothetical protein
MLLIILKYDITHKKITWPKPASAPMKLPKPFRNWSGARAKLEEV